MGIAPTWLRQVSPLFHKTTLTTAATHHDNGFCDMNGDARSACGS